MPRPPIQNLNAGTSGVIFVVLQWCLCCGPWCLAMAGCQPSSSGPADAVQVARSATETVAKPPIRGRHRVDELPFDIVVFETVFWEPRDTTSLRRLIASTDLVHDRAVLEIGTGSGLVALCCLHAGARKVVATDVNPHALANARYNAVMLRLAEGLETRRVSVDDQAAYAALGTDERFDLVISNPPWEDGEPAKIDEYALYDHRFRLLDSLLSELGDHLNEGGKGLLAYGNVTAIRRALELAPQYDLNVKVLDDRDLDALPENFLPGMLLELTPAGNPHDAPEAPME